MKGGSTSTNTWINVTTAHTQGDLVNLAGTAVLNYDVSGPAGDLQSTAVAVYVVGTGIGHSVEDFAKKAFAHVSLNYKDYVVVDKNLVRPSEVDSLIANYSKAKKVLKWKPKISFDYLVASMVESDLEFITKHKY